MPVTYPVSNEPMYSMSKKEKMFILLPLVLWFLWGFTFFIIVTSGSEAVMGLVFIFFPLLIVTVVPIVAGLRRAIIMKERLWTVLGAIVFIIMLDIAYAMFFRGQFYYIPSF